MAIDAKKVPHAPNKICPTDEMHQTIRHNQYSGHLFSRAKHQCVSKREERNLNIYATHSDTLSTMACLYLAQRE